MNKSVYAAFVAALIPYPTFADSGKCAGSPDRYQGSSSGCPDARVPKPSKYNKDQVADEKPAAEVKPQPKVKPVKIKSDGTIVL